VAHVRFILLVLSMIVYHNINLIYLIFRLKFSFCTSTVSLCIALLILLLFLKNILTRFPLLDYTANLKQCKKSKDRTNND